MTLEIKDAEALLKAFQVMIELHFDDCQSLPDRKTFELMVRDTITQTPLPSLAKSLLGVDWTLSENRDWTGINNRYKEVLPPYYGIDKQGTCPERGKK